MLFYGWVLTLSHRGHSCAVAPTFFCPPKFFVPRKSCFNCVIKIKTLPPLKCVLPLQTVKPGYGLAWVPRRSSSSDFGLGTAGRNRVFSTACLLHTYPFQIWCRNTQFPSKCFPLPKAKPIDFCITSPET